MVRLLRYLKETLRVCLGCLFLFSGAAKIADVRHFAGTVADHGILPDVVVLPAALLVSVCEILLGALLSLNVRTREVALILAVLVLCFTASSGWMYLRSHAAECGCFGSVIKRESNVVMMVQNLLVVVSLGLFALRPDRKNQK